MAESYISELGDKLSHGVDNTDGRRVKIIAPKVYDDGNGNHPSISTALSGKEDKSNKVTSIRAASSATDTAYPSEKAVRDEFNKRVFEFTKIHKDNYYASNLCRHFSANTPTQFVIWSGIKYVSARHMPVVRIYGYAYGLQSPIELKIGFYIYDGNIGWHGVVCQGAWAPEVYLWKYTRDSVDYVAIGLNGPCYFCGFQVDVQIGASGTFDTIEVDGWTTSHNGADTSVVLIPEVGTSNCVKADYKTIKTSISGNANTASAAQAGSALETAINGKASATHTHQVSINGLTKTIAATGGTPVNLGLYTEFEEVNDTSVIATNSTAASCKSYFVNNVSNGRCKVVYCKNGVEYTLIFSKQSSGKNGTILRYGYDYKNIYILRYKNEVWQSEDWEKISAGVADTATTAQNYDTSTGTIKTALGSKVPTTTLSVSVPGSSTRYVKMTVPSAYHHYLVFFNASMGGLHAEWMFRTYGTGGIARTMVNYIGVPVTVRKWYVAGEAGLDYYIEFVNDSTAAQSLKFSVCSLDISELPALSTVDTVPSGYTEMTVYGTVAEKLRVARNLAVDLANTATNTSFDGSTNVTNIKTTGVLGVANGGTGNSSVDTQPTENSTKMVTSGGIKTALDDKEDTSNKVTEWGSTPSDTKYPSEKLVKDSLDAKAPNAPSEVTIANGDKLVITDASDSNKIKRVSVAFDGSTTGQLLSKKGTFENPQEAYLSWGGRNITGSYGPLDAALVDVLGANRFAYGKPAGIAIEYTRDGGTTWLDYEAVDDAKTYLVTPTSTASYAFALGKADSTHKATAPENWENYKLRITFTNPTFGLYASIRKIPMLILTNGSAGCQVTIRVISKTNEESGGAWSLMGTMTLSGWSGWNIFNLPSNYTAWSGAATQKSQHSKIEFLFEATAASSESSQQYNGMTVLHIFGYGTTPAYTKPSALADTGHLYQMANDQSAIFPANVKATTFEGKFKNPRKLAVSLSNTSTDTSFDGSADVTNIKTTGTLGVANGGTGKTTARDACNSFINALDVGSSTPVDADYYISQYVGGATTTTTYCRRPVSALWNYIKGKLTSVSGVNISGNAATATDLAANSVLSVSKGGTGKSSVTSNSFLVGNGTSALVEKTPSEVLSLIGGQAALTEMTTTEVTEFVAALGEL